jgi:hypothetical protein
MFGTLGVTPPPGILAAPVNTLKGTFEKTWSEPLAFTKPFPAYMQPYQDFFQPQGFVKSRFPDGWRSHQWESKFAVPFPVSSQPYLDFFTPQGAIHTIFPDGWRGAQWESRLATPFPPAAQSFGASSGEGF